MRAALLALALAATLCGCIAYRVPSLPAIEERPGEATRIFVVVDEHAADEWGGGVYDGPWMRAARFAARLEWAGFSPWIVRATAEVPPDTPYVDHMEESFSPPECSHPLLTLLSLLSLGVVPDFDCHQYGDRFDLHRSAGSPAQVIDTRFRVPVVIGWIAS